ncbi:MAG: dockerin type I repeat-containing protein [Clostridia bacterium]
MEYQVILYGDINGDGKINSVDLLVLQRHILEIQKVSGVALKAGNINKNGKNPSSVDLLLIQRHILQLKIIEQ